MDTGNKPVRVLLRQLGETVVQLAAHADALLVPLSEVDHRRVHAGLVQRPKVGINVVKDGVERKIKILFDDSPPGGGSYFS